MPASSTWAPYAQHRARFAANRARAETLGAVRQGPALLAGWLITPMVGGATINQGDFSLSGLLISLLGAIVLLAIVNLFRRGRAR